MSLQRLTISLHCWPARPRTRRRPMAPSPPDVVGPPSPAEDEALPVHQYVLADVALEGDDVRDVERFDGMIADALQDAAQRLRRVPGHRLVALRDLGYATRVELNMTAEPGTLELALPAELIDACYRLGLGVQLLSDHALLVDPEQHDLVADD